MPWFSLGKLQAWKHWLQRRRQEIVCVLVGLFVGKERCSVVFASWCSLEKRAAAACLPAGKSSFSQETVAFYRKSRPDGFMHAPILLTGVPRHVGV